MDLFKKIEATRQVGSEFLTWLFYKSASSGTGVLKTELGVIELAFEDKISFVSPYASGDAQVLKGVSLGESMDSLHAIAGGRLIDDAKMSVKYQEKRWEFSFSGSKFALQGVKVPAVLADTELETAIERFDLFATLEQVLRSLYHAYLTLRLDEKAWQTEVALIRKWLQQ